MELMQHAAIFRPILTIKTVGKRENIKVKEVGKNIKMEIDQDFNYVKPQDWIKRRIGLQKGLDSDMLNQTFQTFH